ncbi:MAG: hypothetical protein IMY85_11340 [Chloroflexi bacterium]|nr:hypothetical protein [Chloroflexota bacterium]MCK4486849.1 hypothetical protein [Desulfobacterales bacterium]
MIKKIIEQSFPKLKKGGYSVTSPAAIEYNCIAWAAGSTDRWWWPDAQNLYFWPSGATRTETIEAFIRTFETLGFTLCQDGEYETGFEKIAIYVDSKGKPTHAARQVTSGLWTSKLGEFVDIEHPIDGLDSSEYGLIAIIMKRPQ